MSSIPTICNAGCGQPFIITEMPTVEIGRGIEKTSFSCPHCQHEYIAFYADDEIRKLQTRMRRVQRRFADPHENHEDAAAKEAALKRQIKEKMDALRKRVESVWGANDA